MLRKTTVNNESNHNEDEEEYENTIVDNEKDIESLCLNNAIINNYETDSDNEKIDKKTISIYSIYFESIIKSITRSKNKKYNKQTTPASNHIFIVILIMLLFAYFNERNLRINLINEYNNKITLISNDINNQKKVITSLSYDNNELNKLNKELQFEHPIKESLKCPKCFLSLEGEKKNDDDDEFRKKQENAIIQTELYKKVTWSWSRYYNVLTHEIQKLSTELLKLKYNTEINPPLGISNYNGELKTFTTYYVEINLVLPFNIKGGIIIIEMAPAEVMPYSVLMFLSQISSQSWIGCSFFINYGSVLSADTRGDDRCHKKNFENIPGISMEAPFQEFNSNFPHSRLTVGYGGDRAGLSFYISLMNNTIPHGPRGYRPIGGVPKQVDPCFGKIIFGEEIVTKMMHLPLNGGEFEKYLMKEKVIIDSAKIISIEDVKRYIESDAKSKLLHENNDVIIDHDLKGPTIPI